MLENKHKQYWMKLHTSFFDKHEIKLMWNTNREYVLLFIRMMIESIPYEGRLRFSGDVPYTASDLSDLFGFPSEIVESGLKFFCRYKLAQIETDGTIYLPFANKCIVAQTQWAQIKRQQRENDKLENGWKRLNKNFMSSPDGSLTIKVNETECGGHGMLAISKTNGKCSVCGSSHNISVLGGKGEETQLSDLRVLCSTCAAAERIGEQTGVAPKLLTVKTITTPPESFEEIVSYLTDSEHIIIVNRPALEAKFTELTNRGWKDRKGHLIRDWKSFFLGMATRHLNKAVALAKGADTSK